MITFERIRAGEAGCPSDRSLDRLGSAEVTPEEQRALEAHVRGCTACGVRMRERELRFAAFSGLDATAVLARVEAQRTAEAGSSRWLRMRPAQLAMLGSFALAALALLAIVRHQQHDTEAGLRLKGALSLRVHRQRGERSEQVLSGAAFAVGDRLRFEIDTPSPGYVSVLGVEANGDLYRAWPAESAGKLLNGAQQRLLEGAVVLDEAKGRETLYLVHCPEAVGVPRCESRGAGSPLACPAHCSLSPFVLEKH